MAGLRHDPGESPSGERQLLLAVGVGLPFLLYAVAVAAQLRLLDYDEAIFMDVARSIRATGLPVRDIAPDGVLYFEHTPLYPYVLSLISWAGGDSARALSILYGLGTIVLVVRTVPGLGGVVAGLLVALSPLFVREATAIHMEAQLAFLVVLAIFLMSRERPGWAGVAAAAAVLTKELALIFVIAATAYLLMRRSPADALRFILSPVLAFAAWLAWAFATDAERLAEVLSRWSGSAAGSDADARTSIGWLPWTWTVSSLVVGPAALLLWLASIPPLLRRRVPEISLLLGSYVVLALTASLLIALKEPRHLIAVIPALAMLLGLIIPWTGRRAFVAVVLIVLLSASIPLPPLIAGRIAEEGPLSQVRDEAIESTEGVVTHPVYPPVAGWYSGKPYALPSPEEQPSAPVSRR